MDGWSLCHPANLLRSVFMRARARARSLAIRTGARDRKVLRDFRTIKIFGAAQRKRFRHEPAVARSRFDCPQPVCSALAPVNLWPFPCVTHAVMAISKWEIMNY